MRSWKLLPAALTALIVMVALVACDSTDPTAPESSTLDVSANPTSVDLSSAQSATSTITALVLNESGVGVPGIKVYFTTTSGTLASNGNGVKTGSNGSAKDVLTLRTNDDDATVSARAPGIAGEQTVTVSTEGPAGNTAPIARITVSSAIAKIGESISFNGSDSSDSDGTVQTWKWTFNYPTGSGTTTEVVQGNAAAASIVSKTFPAAGTVTASLQVTDNDGDSSSLTLPGGVTIIASYPPTAVIDPPGPLFANVPFIVDGRSSFDDSRDPGGTIVRYDWNMGDGSAGMFTNTTTGTQGYVYTTTGSKTITLKVYDNGTGAGCDSVTHLCTGTQSTSAQVTVQVQ